MNTTPAERVSDFAKIAARALKDYELSLRGKDENAQKSLTRMVNGEATCSPENLFTIAGAIWELVTEPTKKTGRQDAIVSFWKRLLRDLRLRQPPGGMGSTPRLAA